MEKQQKDRTAKGGRTRSRIIETATKMMSEKGPDAVSMREIALHLKITKPVLYYYFKDKETLIRAAFHEGARHFRELDTLVLDESIPLEKKIELILSNHLSFIKKNPDMPKCALKIIASPSDGVLGGMALEMKKEHQKMLRQVINNAALKGEVAKEAANDISHLLSAAITHFIIEAKENGPAALDNGMPARFARIICAGASPALLATKQKPPATHLRQSTKTTIQKCGASPALLAAKRKLPVQPLRLAMPGKKKNGPAKGFKAAAAALLLSSILSCSARAAEPELNRPSGGQAEVNASTPAAPGDSQGPKVRDLPRTFSVDDATKVRGLSLNGAVRTALKNNATVVTAEKTRNIYKEKIKEYWGTVYPQISASGQYTRNIESPSFFIGGQKIKTGLNNSYTGALNLNQVLWSGGKVHTGIRMANMYAADSDEQLKTAQNGISKAVKQMYYAVLLSSSLASIQQETLNLASQHLSTIETQYKQGIASDLEVLRQQVEVSNTEPALTQALNLYEEGRIELKNLLGLDPETEITLTDGLTCAKNGPGEITELYKTALLSRPEYRDAKIQRDLYMEMIKVSQADHYPYISAFASRQFQGQADSGFPAASGQSWATTAGLSLSLPLFSGGSISSRVAQARLQADIAETDLKELERKIKIAVKEAWLGLKEASMRLESQTTSVETARKALTATEVRFKNGLASQLELNDTSLALNKSQTLYIQALHDTCSADTELKWTLGE